MNRLLIQIPKRVSGLCVIACVTMRQKLRAGYPEPPGMPKHLFRSRIVEMNVAIRKILAQNPVSGVILQSIAVALRDLLENELRPGSFTYQEASTYLSYLEDEYEFQEGGCARLKGVE